MNTSSQIFIQTLEHNKELLEKEIAVLFPSWNKILDKGSFVVYEMSRVYSTEEIGDLPISFSININSSLVSSLRDFFSKSSIIICLFITLMNLKCICVPINFLQEILWYNVVSTLLFREGNFESRQSLED